MYFHDHGIEEVMKIRIPQQQVEDVLAWHDEDSGIFMVIKRQKCLPPGSA